MSETMTDISEMNKRVSRIEGSQQGLNTYLPLLLKRFEGIEQELKADMNATRQELKDDLKATEQKLEADLNDIRKENSEGIARLQSDNRNLIIALILTGIGVAATGLAIAASIYFT